MDVQIEKLRAKDLTKFLELIRIFEDVFEMQEFTMPPKDYLQKLLEKEDFFAFVALLDGKVIGGLTSYILHQYYAVSPLVYIFDLAVKTEFQRQGIGKKLIAGNNAYCKTLNAEVVMVQADEADGYALDFYRSTGGIPEKVVHFDYNLQKP